MTERLGRWLMKDAYKTYLARAKRSIDNGRFPQSILDRLEKDMTETLPTVRMFVPGSPMRDDLREFICAWVVYRSDDGLGYVSNANLLICMRLIPGTLHHSLRRDVASLLASLSSLLDFGQPPRSTVSPSILYANNRRDRCVLSSL